jgi:hypothetical protein
MQEATPIPNEGDFDVLTERFFSQPPPEWLSAHDAAHDDWQPEPMSSIERVAMLTTAAPAMAMLAVAVTLLSDSLLIAVPRPVAMPIEPPQVHVTADLQVASSQEPAKPVAISAPTFVPTPITQVQPAAALPPPRRARKHDSGAKRARQLLDAGNALAARDFARDVVRRAPARAEGYIVLAAALDKLGDRAGMNATFRECARLATDPLASACKSLARQR